MCIEEEIVYCSIGIICRKKVLAYCFCCLGDWYFKIVVIVYAGIYD